MTYYGFDKTTARCIFTASGPIEPSERYEIIVSDETYEDISTLMLVEGIITEVGLDPAYIESNQVAFKQDLMWRASQQIETLRDVLEFYPENEDAKTLCMEWRKYRADLYLIDATLPDPVWPEMPAVFK